MNSWNRARSGDHVHGLFLQVLQQSQPAQFPQLQIPQYEQQPQQPQQLQSTQSTALQHPQLSSANQESRHPQLALQVSLHPYSYHYTSSDYFHDDHQAQHQLAGMSPLTQPTHGKQAPHFDQESTGAWFQLQPHQQFMHPQQQQQQALYGQGLQFGGTRYNLGSFGYTQPEHKSEADEYGVRAHLSGSLQLYSGRKRKSLTKKHLSDLDIPQAKVVTKRSRMGCLTCRQRKKRCCETKPRCAECFRLGLSCVWPKPGTEHKNKQKDAKLEENTIDHEIYGKIKVLRGIVECRTK